MTKQICEINTSSWFYNKEICYDARSHERKIQLSSSLEVDERVEGDLP
jgi:hypothetical protein